MKPFMFMLPLVVSMILGIYFAISLTKNSSMIPSVLINKPIAEFSLAPIKGRDKGLSSDDLKNEVTLVNFWGSWCISCKIEHPFLMKLKRQNIIPIHGVDWRETNPDDGPNWLKKHGDPYTLIGDDPKSKVAIAFGVYGAPETFIIDNKGIIRYKYVGPMSQRIWDKIMLPIIQRLRQQ